MSSTAMQIHNPESTPLARVAQTTPAGTFAEMLELAAALVPTGFLPDHIKTPGQAVAIILQGRELGMEPMRALRSLTMVKGKVVESADSQLARFKDEGGRAQFKVLSETDAELWLRHPNGDEHTERFTIKDAENAGLLKQSDMYRKYPKAMLRSRVITAGLKSLGWSGAVGNYDPDEAAAFAPPGAAAAIAAVSDASNVSSAAPAQRATAESVAGEGERNLAWAAALPLMGKPASWENNGRKPIGEVPDNVLKQARHFFKDKVAENPNDERTPRMREQITAISLVIDDRAANTDQETLPLAGERTAPTPAAVAASAGRAEVHADAEEDLPF